MRKATFFIVTVTLLSACRLLTGPETNTAPLPEHTRVAPEGEASAASAAPTSVQDETAAPATPTLEQSRLPQPTLFDVSWSDHEPYRPGLVNREQIALINAPGSNVYHIEMRLNDTLRRVEARQELLIRNRESEPLESLYLHLFPNLLGGEIDVSMVKVNGRDAISEFVFDRSVMRIPVDAPLQPGEEVVVSLAFATAVPTDSTLNYGIFSLSEDILALAHFYPQVAVFDDDGWNIEPPVAQGDIVYAEVGYYLVRVTAPARQVLVASGIELSRTMDGPTQTVTFAAGPVRDFYLAASERYDVWTDTVGETRVNSYAPAQFSDEARDVLDYTLAALQIFAGRFGPYPYTELDIVSTPNLALGVEYPGVFANNLRLYGAGEPEAEGRLRDLLESTSVHETAHQWFYGVVGNDQLDEPWLDEALAQYATWLYYIDRYGAAGAQPFYDALERSWQSVDRADIPIGLPVSGYEGALYAPIVYARGPIFLDELANTIGQETFDAFLKEYYQTHQWQIATTEGFQLLAEQHCRCDLDPLFREWVWPD